LQIAPQDPRCETDPAGELAHDRFEQFGVVAGRLALEAQEGSAAEDAAAHSVPRYHRCGAGAAVEERHLAEEHARDERLDSAPLRFPFVRGADDDVDGAVLDQVEPIALVPLTKQHVTRVDITHPHRVEQALASGGFELAEQRVSTGPRHGIVAPWICQRLDGVGEMTQGAGDRGGGGGEVGVLVPVVILGHGVIVGGRGRGRGGRGGKGVWGVGAAPEPLHCTQASPSLRSGSLAQSR
jgi:hypothetical protein